MVTENGLSDPTLPLVMRSPAGDCAGGWVPRSSGFVGAASRSEEWGSSQLGLAQVASSWFPGFFPRQPLFEYGVVEVVHRRMRIWEPERHVGPVLPAEPL